MKSNEALIRKLFALFGRRQLDEAVVLFSEDAVFHVPGRSAISGTYRGRDGVLRYWHRQIDSTPGSFRTQPHAIDSKGDHVVVEVQITAERDGRDISWHRTVDYRIAGGRIVEASIVEGDQAKADGFFGRRAEGDKSMPGRRINP